MADDARRPGSSLSRRRLLGGGVAALGAVGIGAAAASSVASTREGSPHVIGSATVVSDGDHQAGVDTPAQAHALFVGLDLGPDVGRDEFIGIMRVWTDDIARLTSGRAALADTEPELASSPARLTVTVGYGPGVFTAVGRESARPSWAAPLPAFGIDRLDPAYTGGDLVLQICADDPITVSHTARVLMKNVRSLTTVRWTQRGFRRARGSDADGTTMRNLMGQVDGTVNPSPSAPDFSTLVWDDGSAQPWLAGGTSMVLRRIRMELDTWDELDRPGREETVGRTLDTGAPLTGTRETDDPDLAATDAFGIPIISPGSHIARAHHVTDGERIFRRAYNYDDPPELGRISNSGLLFVSFQRDVDRQFVPIQKRLDDFDALNEWTTPVGSAVFVVPPGVGGRRFLGESLFD